MKSAPSIPGPGWFPPRILQFWPNALHTRHTSRWSSGTWTSPHMVRASQAFLQYGWGSSVLKNTWFCSHLLKRSKKTQFDSWRLLLQNSALLLSLTDWDGCDSQFFWHEELYSNRSQLREELCSATLKEKRPISYEGKCNPLFYFSAPSIWTKSQGRPPKCDFESTISF